MTIHTSPSVYASHAAGEPRLDEILADPIMQHLFRRDRLEAHEVAHALTREQLRLAGKGHAAASGRNRDQVQPGPLAKAA